jgi:Ca2+-binding RTX toxin-like protein
LAATVIDGVLVGTLDDDAGNLQLHAGKYRVNAVFGDYGDDLLVANPQVVSTSGGLPSPSAAIDISNYGNVLNGGHGKDRLVGSDLDDLLISQADSREPVIAQAWDADDDPLGEINPNTNTYYADQPIEGDDVLFGGGGADLFYFQTLINAKDYIIQRHVGNDGTINWGTNGVAGENDNVHDHWVDGLGDELIADFNGEEGDHILIEGHTTEVYMVEYIDSDGDRIFDSTVLHVWSNQGNGGGAHNKDLLGTITVADALLTAEDYTTTHVNYGIVPTIAELNEATTPYFGIPDDGRPPQVPQVADGKRPDDAVLFLPGELTFSGENEDYAQIEHYEDLELAQGTVAMTFVADDVSGRQALFSKDARGQEAGGHLTAFVHDDRIEVRLQSTEHSQWLRTAPGSVQAGEEYHLTISFGPRGVWVYLDGVMRDWDAEFVQGLDTNLEELAVGANIWARSDADPRYARNEFAGTISNFTIYDLQLSHEKIAVLGGVTEQPPLTEPTVIQDVLVGTLRDDVKYGQLDANRFEVNAVFGDYGDDLLIANSQVVTGINTLPSPSEVIDLSDFANMLNGGHGQDRLIGSELNDLLISRADSREPVIAQAWDADDDPLGEIDSDTNTYYSQQPIAGDDVLIGGGGADLFYFQTLINAKDYIILRHVNVDGTIDWGPGGVAGENDNVHDHWVDGLGHELIADFSRADGDHILIEGHTTEVYRVEYIDSDQDQIVDSTVLHIWSNQGGGGGAHNKDLLGTITVADALLTAEDYTTNHRNYGIVPNVAELHEATTPYTIAPDDGVAPPIPPVADGLSPPRSVLYVPDELTFSGEDDDYAQIEHYGQLELEQGTVAMTFMADRVTGRQTLFSKDATGQEIGGHLTAFVHDGRVQVRLQSTAESEWLDTPASSVQPGVEYHVAITFGPAGFQLYLNGVLADAKHEFTQGIGTNLEELALGANIWGRSENDPLYAHDEFHGTISGFTIYDVQVSQSRDKDLGAAASSPEIGPLSGATVPLTVREQLPAQTELKSRLNFVDAVFSKESQPRLDTGPPSTAFVLPTEELDLERWEHAFHDDPAHHAWSEDGLG